jgi:hypothetical protein
MTVLHAYGPAGSILDEGQAVQLVNELPRHWCLENGMGLFEVTLHDLNRKTIDVARRMLCQKTAHVSLKTFIGEMTMEEAHP